MKITLDYPPSANRYWRMAKDRRTGYSRMVRSAEANAYRDLVGWICLRDGITPLDGDVCVTLRVYRPQRSGDLDNRLKVALDALQEYAYYSDEQIVEIRATRHDDKANPRVEIEIEVKA